MVEDHEYKENVMNRNVSKILIVYVFHIICIVMSFWLMQYQYDTLQTIFFVFGGLYLVYWIISNRKRYMPWSVYVHFIIGTIIQIMLNISGVIPEDSGWFSGLGQLLYTIFLAGYTVLLGFGNLVLYAIAKKGKRNRL